MKFRERVLEEGTLSQAELDETEAKVTEQMDDAVRFSDESPAPDLSELLTDVYVDSPKGSLGRSAHLFT
jgi:pyruvate dehydrogenase E1 component alpha subunit